jgi:hypothetical protein
MNTFNGYAPGESRTQKSRPEARDGGHSIVERTTTRQGHSFSFVYRVTCECGKTFSGRTYSTPFYTHIRHLKREGVL